MIKSKWSPPTVDFQENNLIHEIAWEGDLIQATAKKGSGYGYIVGIYLGLGKRSQADGDYYLVLYDARVVTLDPYHWNISVLQRIPKKN